MERDDLVKADRWLRAYVHEIQSGGIGGAKAQNPVDSEGRYYLRRCSKCKGKVRHGTNEGSYVCGHCGALWPYRDRYVLKGEVQTSRDIGAAEGWFIGQIRIDQPTVSSLANVFWRLSSAADPWPWRIYVATTGAGLTFRDLEARGRDVLPDAPMEFSRATIARRHRVGRELWATGLREAGLL